MSSMCHCWYSMCQKIWKISNFKKSLHCSVPLPLKPWQDMYYWLWESFLSFFCVLFFFFQQILSRYFCKIYFNENYLYPSLNPILVPGNGVALVFDCQSGMNCCTFCHIYTRVIIQVTSYGRNKNISPVMPQWKVTNHFTLRRLLT